MKPGDVVLVDRARLRVDSRKEVFVDQKANKGHSMVVLFLGTVELFARKVDPDGFGRLRALGWLPQREASAAVARALEYAEHKPDCDAPAVADCSCGLDELRGAG